MKNKLILILLIALVPCCLFTQNYYYSKDNKISIKTNSSKNFYLTFDDELAIEDTELNKFEIKINLHKNKSNKAVYWTIGSMLNGDKWDYISPTIIMPDGSELNFSHLFYVKLKDKDDMALLEKISTESNVKILGNNEFMPLWYTLACTKDSKGNALEMANLFTESKLFSATEVDFLVNASFDCLNDNIFPYQYSLKNTGQLNGTVGVDINYCPASSYTKGSPDLIIAIVDGGVQYYHDELNSSILWNHVYNVHFKQQSFITYDNYRHGTRTAGVIFADHNNYNIAGIAPNCKLMQINFDGTDTTTVPLALNLLQDLSDGINYAWQNGASIINNSWTIKNTAVTSHAIFDDAINATLTQGRNSKGCVVVFASGNNSKPTVNYPASSNSDIIAVGSIDRHGLLSYFSNYGTALDVVAPGDNIYTIDPRNLPNVQVIVSGTSLSAPHASGVVALILSVNPNLTQKQVADIIEFTVQKVGGYNYKNTLGRDNGTWNNEMGYGLVDAYEAVKMASCWKNIHNLQPMTTNMNEEGCVIDVKNVTVPSGATLELKATERIVINSGVTVKTGGTLILDGQVMINSGYIVEAGAKFVVE